MARKDRPSISGITRAEILDIKAGLLADRRKPSLDDRVYFIECDYGDRPIKIGVSRDPKIRLSDHQVSCPWDLRIMHTTPGSFEDEHALHRRFAADLIRGEWFMASPSLLRLVLESKRAAALLCSPDRSDEIDGLARAATSGSQSMRDVIFAMRAFDGTDRADDRVLPSGRRRRPIVIDESTLVRRIRRAS